MSANNPSDRVVGPWEAVIDDMAATAAEYRETGFAALELHPGDVTVLDSEGDGLDGEGDDGAEAERNHGLDVLVPDDEFEELEGFADAAAFDDYELYRADEEGMVFGLVVLRDADDERVVCCPLYYDVEAAESMLHRAREAGVLYTHIRPLADDRAVTFSHEHPEHFA